jgi:hypothetical protein
MGNQLFQLNTRLLTDGSGISFAYRVITQEEEPRNMLRALLLMRPLTPSEIVSRLLPKFARLSYVYYVYLVEISL